MIPKGGKAIPPAYTEYVGRHLLAAVVPGAEVPAGVERS